MRRRLILISYALLLPTLYYFDAAKHAVEIEQQVDANQHLKNLGNVQVVDAHQAAGTHCKVPITYWEERIKAAASSKAKP